MPKGPTKRRPETRRRLLDAAMEAFAELGFGGATIDEICRRAGYTTGAYYSNFASKDELFYALFDEHAGRAIERAASRLANLEDLSPNEDKLPAIFTGLDPEERQWYMVSTEFSLYAIRNPEAAAVLAEHDAKIRAQLTQVLAAQFDRLGRRPRVDLDQLARLLIAVREGALLQSLVEPDALPPGTLEQTFVPPLLRVVSEEVTA